MRSACRSSPRAALARWTISSPASATATRPPCSPRRSSISGPIASARRRHIWQRPGSPSGHEQAPRAAVTAPPRSATSDATATRGPAMAPIDGSVLDRLHAVISSRRGADPAASYTAKLFARGTAKIAQKLGEEAVETVIEAVAGNRNAVVGESADLLYHLMVLWAAAGVTPGEVWQALEAR